MRLLLSRNLIATAPLRYAQQYPPDKYLDSDRFGLTRNALAALDTSTATAKDVADIIGNKSWSYITCSECAQQVEQAVEFSEQYSDHSTTLCPSCCRAAAALASVVL